MEVVDDSENRITIGGKRRSSSRRSSILKATKSPCKSGALEDLDLNSLDDKGRSKSKKARRSSGRRVSFAEKNEIKEFFTEDWQSSWKKEVEKNNVQVKNSASQGEYREPAESIQGLETLLKGDIQADHNQLCTVELQNMPEVQFSEISEGSEANTINYDRGILLQSVTQEQIQQTGPCVFMSTTNFGPAMPMTYSREQVDEMEYTKCVNSGQFLPHAAQDVESGDVEQTRIFSDGMGIDLDETCSRQEIFFPNYPNAPLSSPTDLEGKEEKRDATAFLASLKSSSSRLQENSEETLKIDSTSFLESLQQKPCSSTTGNVSRKRQPFSDVTDKKADENRTLYQEVKSEDDLELTTCHGSHEVFENRGMHKRERRSIYEPADVDVTLCHGSGLSYQTDYQLQELPNQMRIFKDGAGIELDETCSQQEISFRSYPNAPVSSATNLEGKEEKRDATAFLESLKSGSSTFQENSEETFKVDSTSFLESLQQKSCLSGTGNVSHKRQPFCDVTDTKEKVNYDHDDLELTTCYSSHEVLENCMHKGEKSICEPADLDVELNVTACYGGIIEDTSNFGPEMPSIDSPQQAEEMDYTKCFSSSHFLQNTATNVESGDHDQTRIFSGDAGVELDVTCSQRGTFFQNYPKEEKRDATAFLASLQQKPSFVQGNDVCTSATENISPKRKPSGESAGQRSVTSRQEPLTTPSNLVEREDNKGRQPFSDITGKNTARSEHSIVSSSGSGTQQESNFDNDLELTKCYNYEVQTNTQKTKRRSIYEPADIDVTSCYGLGLVNLSDRAALDRRSTEITGQRLNNNTYEQADPLDMTTCYGSGILPNRRSSLADKDCTVVFSAHKMDTSVFKKSSAAADSNDEMDFTSTIGSAPSSNDNFALGSSWKVMNGTEKTESQESKPLCSQVKEDDNVELTACHSYKVLDNNMQKSKRRSIYEPADVEITSCHGPGLTGMLGTQAASSNMNSTLKLEATSQEAAVIRPNNSTVSSKTQDLSVTMQQKPEESELEVSTCRTRIHKMKIKNYFRSSEVDPMSCFGSRSAKSSEQQATSNSTSNSPYDILNMPGCSEVATGRLNNSNTTLNKTQDLQSQTMPEQLEESTLEIITNHSQEDVEDKEITSQYNQRKLSIIEETESEISKSEEQNVTQRPITLKEFLDITEIVFITEVNTRRSIAIMPSTAQKSAQTPKDMIVSSLVTAPKVACYEDAITTVESQITEMKEKVKQQEVDLNAENLPVFMEAQTASKQELSAMRSEARRLRSACEKKAKREWKERKHQLNKTILSKLTENHQGLASDVHIVEESLAMVDDCFNLLDKMDKDLDEGIKGFQLSIDESEKKLQEKTSKAKELEGMKETLQKSEQELVELESKRDSFQTEKQELDSVIGQHKEKVHELEEHIKLLKQQVEDSKAENAKRNARLQKEYDLLESLHEWTLDEWDEEHAKFTFLKETVDMVVLFSPKSSGEEGASPDQEVQKIQLNFAERINPYQRCVHAAINQRTNSDRLTQMCPTKTSLTEVLYHMSWILYDSKCIGDELFRIGLKHLTTLEGNRFTVLFNSMKAKMTFEMHFQLDFESYPERVTFTVSLQFGPVSQAEIEETLKAVSGGRWYLSRLVEAGEEIINQAIPPSSS